MPGKGQVQTIMAQHHRDQAESPKAIVANNVMNKVNSGLSKINSAITSSFRNNSLGRGYLKQQESLDAGYFPPVTPITEDIYNSHIIDVPYQNNKDTHQEQYIEHQDSVESYVEEGNRLNCILMSWSLLNHLSKTFLI